MGNFAFFTGAWAPYGEIAEAAEKMVYTDPNASMTKMRAFGEMMAAELWVRNKFPAVEQITQYDRIKQLEGNDMIDRQIAFYFHELRVKGNKAAHNAMYGTSDEAIALLSVAYQLSMWFMRIELDNPTFHAPPFKKPLETPPPRTETPFVTPKEPPKRRVAKREPALKKKPVVQQKPVQVDTPKQVEKERTTPPPQQATRIVRKRVEQQPTSSQPKATPKQDVKWMPIKWLAVLMFVVGGMTAAALGNDRALGDQLLNEQPVEQKAPPKKKTIELIRGDETFETDALRLLRGDGKSKEKIDTYADAGLTEKAGKILVKDSYAIYEVKGEAYALNNGQFVSKEAIAQTKMEDLAVYQATFNPEASYGTITVILDELLNVRSGPSTNDEIVGVTYRGMTYSVYGQSGSWYRIDQNVWISANPQYVTFEKTPVQGSET
ncbi:SH3 domain-containing protein [Kurthia massiliensis]|uniref:SH3 domain-containing protein n=1 Tax=Kurthia massiliensis TaxID=1033739 RepID=UPI000287D7B1|nr:SH3 domain-containing protein [Kurthia massiliensis]